MWSTYSQRLATSAGTWSTAATCTASTTRTTSSPTTTVGVRIGCTRYGCSRSCRSIIGAVEVRLVFLVKGKVAYLSIALDGDGAGIRCRLLLVKLRPSCWLLAASRTRCTISAPISAPFSTTITVAAIPTRTTIPVSAPFSAAFAAAM
jgi:hypothetical protein